MLMNTASMRRWRQAGPFDYAVALLMVGIALASRAALQPIAPNTGPYVLLLPAVVLAGIFCGTLPAAVGAALGGAVTSRFFFSPDLFKSTVLSAAQLDAALFSVGCALILWGTHTLRSAAGKASLAEARLAEIFRQFPGAAAIVEAPSGRLLMRSAQSDLLLGHAPLKAIGVGEMSGYGGLAEDGEAFSTNDYPIMRALRIGESCLGASMRYARPDGRVADFEVYAGPVRNAHGQIVAAVGMAFDVSARREAERRLTESEARARLVAEQLRAALAERDVLMREADHRIKNSLQLVVSMLRLQLAKATEPATQQALSGAIGRVGAVANAHLALQSSADLRTMEIDPMLRELCDRVGTLNPAVEISCESVTGEALDATVAVPLGLIASELLTNALRHGFAPGVVGRVWLRCSQADGEVTMEIADDGRGLPAAPGPAGLGSSVVRALSRQIGAKVGVVSSPGQGVVVTVRMALPTGPPARDRVDAARV